MTLKTIEKLNLCQVILHKTNFREKSKFYINLEKIPTLKRRNPLLYNCINTITAPIYGDAVV